MLENLKPEKPFYYFEEISKIPRGSGDTKAISDYLVSFAKEHGLNYIQDKVNNVIIFKDGTKGYENSEPVIIQGHMDMVCEKEKNSKHDFSKDPLELEINDDFISAKETTLGGDDGVAVAIGLAILDSNDIPHPPIEAVFTVDEETSMLGASHIDLSKLKGKKIINIDSENMGTLTVGCAGGLDVKVKLDLDSAKVKGSQYEVSISNLVGGHSGTEIDKERGNANVLLARVLNILYEEYDILLVDMKGGSKRNAIPVSATASIVLDTEYEKEVSKKLEKIEKELKNEYKYSDKDISISMKRVTGEKTLECINSNDTLKIISLLMLLPNGVDSMNAAIPSLVESSSNVAIVECNGKHFCVDISVRSSVSSKKYTIADKITVLANLIGASVETGGDYPAWEYKKDSKLSEIMTKVYERKYGEKPKVEVIHAGLECGIFSEKIKGMDAVSIGPDIYDIHTFNERLSISSFKECYEFVEDTLGELK
ncbi:dipeptidase D [Acetitomaculum ruminis DSM 5522]|uniref:Cytosol non-specific dipeptidase n=1 Tax=Acetitomaculum ruminis DSM 5522 TaxID=1120918 RepID=A0A1I0V921_9FIRM|nr:aminoacyl-histidine dipeptidase [Acetitomaculum ruminis]SFA72884.1 dipeptidase D [Acetitomaculum ruminis DSM 5522]